MKKRDHQYYVYIMTNYTNSVLYTGVSGKLNERVWAHKNKVARDSFTSKYNINKLVYIEDYQYINDALEREKQIKAISRAKKQELIAKENPNYNDLSDDF